MTNDWKGRVLVLGGRGMLGRAVAKESRLQGWEVVAAGSEMDITSLPKMLELERQIHPHIVINCTGVIPIRLIFPRTLLDMIQVNAIGPWVMRQAFQVSKLIHVSTDCVFSGDLTSGHAYYITHPTSGRDLYGRSKAMGEIPDAMVIRTSFIGFEHGLLNWVSTRNPGTHIDGWKNALWTGGTVYDVAKALVGCYESHRVGLEHLAAAPMNKAQLIRDLVFILQLDLEVDEVEEPHVNRMLHPTIPLERRLDQLDAVWREKYAGQRSLASRA
jgi:dTDP-4-dehydrorhamnose reductase